MANKTSTYERLKQMIFDGEIGEGEVLIEREIGERLGVSRVPVREALLRLAVEGLILSSPGRGLVARTYNFQDIAEIYLFREALDGMAARLCAIRADENELEYLKLVYQDMETHIEEKYSDPWVRKDREFHNVIIKGCRNTRIAQALETVYGECFFLRYKYFSQALGNLSEPERTQVASEVLLEHKRILEAIVAGDPNAAETTARESDRSAHNRMLQLYAATRSGAEAK